MRLQIRFGLQDQVNVSTGAGIVNNTGRNGRSTVAPVPSYDRSYPQNYRP